jgi:uncharacterized protein (TIGR02677 family)
MLSAAGTGVSRRADLLRLARWFADADAAGSADEAHRLFAAAYGAYPARHLALGPDEASARAGALTSWWDADPVEVPVSLRERGDRVPRGRAACVPDPGLDREALLADTHADRERDRAAAAELVATGRLDGARITPAARDMVLDRLGELLAICPGDEGTPIEWLDAEVGFVLRAEPAVGHGTHIRADDGDLTVDDFALFVATIDTAADRHIATESTSGRGAATGTEG